MNCVEDKNILQQYKGTPELYDLLLAPNYQSVHKTLWEVKLFKEFLEEKYLKGWGNIEAHEIWYARKGEERPVSRTYNEEDGSYIIEWVESFDDLCREIEEREYFLDNYVNDILMNLITHDDINAPKLVYTEIQGIVPYRFQDGVQKWREKQINQLEGMIKRHPKIMEREFADISYFKELNPNSVDALDEAVRYSLSNKKEIIFSHPNEVVIARFLSKEENDFDEETNVEYASQIMEMKEEFLKYYIENFKMHLFAVNDKSAIAT